MRERVSEKVRRKQNKILRNVIFIMKLSVTFRKNKQAVCGPPFSFLLITDINKTYSHIHHILSPPISFTSNFINLLTEIL